MSETIPVTVKILDKEYRIACPKEEQNSLLASADLLNQQMTELRDSGKVMGADRIAVMAALNLTHELLQNRNEMQGSDKTTTKRLESMLKRVEEALQDSQQMEI
jgi:cell division protein ZapA